MRPDSYIYIIHIIHTGVTVRSLQRAHAAQHAATIALHLFTVQVIVQYT